MKDIFLKIKVLSIILFLTMASGAKASYPVVRNFTRNNFSGGAQTWDIQQDSAGYMFFGNKYGMMRFDGHIWRHYAIGNETEVRSLLYEHETGRIYAGGSEEFGYFLHNPEKHELEYRSLSEMLRPERRHFKEIWNIHKLNGRLWFQGDYSVFRYDGNHIKEIEFGEKLTSSGVAGGVLVIGSQTGRLWQVKSNLAVEVPAELLRGKRIVSILPWNNGPDALIVTEFDGLFILSGQDVRRLPTDMDSFFRENQMFSSATNGTDYAFGTVNKGLVIKNFSTGHETYVNKGSGLQNNTVLTIDFSSDGNIWAGLDNGIDYIRYNSPYSLLLGTKNSYGTGYSSCLYGGQLYIGTNQGLYQSVYPIASGPENPDFRQSLKGQIWEVKEVGGTLMVCGEAGLFQLAGDSFSRIDGIVSALAVRLLDKNPDYALVSTPKTFYLLRKTGGRWISEGPVKGYDDTGGSFIVDQNGDIWIANWLRGVYRMHPNVASRSFDFVKFYNSKNGLNSDKNNGIVNYGGHIAVSSGGEFFTLDPSSDKMRPDVVLNGIFPAGTAGRARISPEGDIWNVSHKGQVAVASQNETGGFSIDSITYIPMMRNINIGFEDIYFMPTGNILVSSLDGFYDVDSDWKDTSRVHFDTFVEEVTNGDNVLYAHGDDVEELIVDYGSNSLKFKVVNPEYRAENAVRYSFFLEDYDKDWSDPQIYNYKDYTQLKEGRYVLRVRAFDSYTGVTGETEFRFRVKPPFYRSAIAYTLYSLLVLILIWLGVKWVRRWTENKEKKLAERNEAELREVKRAADAEAMKREIEISDLKDAQLELDVKHKSEELSSAMLNLVRKNEILIKISESLTRLLDNVKEGAQTKQIEGDVNKINSMIQNNISHDDDWRKFVHNFDAVYEGFIKRLIEAHPGLTRTELRICCYLRMGLSSKDMAPLFNISYRSVEMARYRLRKKLELGREDNLIVYLEKI